MVTRPAVKVLQMALICVVVRLVILNRPNTPKKMIMACTIMGVPRTTVLYTRAKPLPTTFQNRTKSLSDRSMTCMRKNTRSRARKNAITVPNTARATVVLKPEKKMARLL